MFYKLLLSLCVVQLFIVRVSAIEVTPMVVTFSPEHQGTAPSSLIYNQLPRQIAFDIEIYEIDFSTEEPSLILIEDSPLWVFPPSLLLGQGQSQRIQFQWLSKDLPKTDKSYQVSLVEQQLSNKSNGSELTVLLNVNLVVHLDQKALKPDLNILDPSISKNQLTAKIVNQGLGASRLSDYEINVVINKNKIIHFKKFELKAAGYDIFFAPNSISDLKITLPEKLSDTVIKSLQVDLVE